MYRINIIMQELECSETMAKEILEKMEFTDFATATKEEIMLDARAAFICKDVVCEC